MPARWNIAMSAALAELHCAGAIPDTLRFHRYPRSVLVGRHQRLRREVRAERCHSKKIEIARRVTDGGTVCMSPSILAWDLVIERRHFGPWLGDASEFMGTAMAAGLARLGLPARFKSRDEIVIDGRQNGGVTAKFDGSSLMVQGTIQIEPDPDDMSAVLKTTAATEKHQTQIASVSEFLGRVPPLEEVEAVLIAQLSHALRRTIVCGAVGVEETALTEHLLIEEIGTEAFVADVHGREVVTSAREAHVQ
jgi:lipoate-protein ligase A